MYCVVCVEIMITRRTGEEARLVETTSAQCAEKYFLWIFNYAKYPQALHRFFSYLPYTRSVHKIMRIMAWLTDGLLRGRTRVPADSCFCLSWFFFASLMFVCARVLSRCAVKKKMKFIHVDDDDGLLMVTVIYHNRKLKLRHPLREMRICICMYSCGCIVWPL